MIYALKKKVMMTFKTKMFRSLSFPNIGLCNNHLNRIASKFIKLLGITIGFCSKGLNPQNCPARPLVTVVRLSSGKPDHGP